MTETLYISATCKVMVSDNDLIVEKDERMYADDFKWFRYICIGLGIFVVVMTTSLFFHAISQDDLMLVILINLGIVIIFAIPLGLLTFGINYYKNRLIQIKFDAYNRQITWVNKNEPNITLKRLYFSEVGSILIKRAYHDHGVSHEIFLVLEDGRLQKLLSGDKNKSKCLGVMISNFMQKKLEGKNSFIILHALTIAVIGIMFFPIIFWPVSPNALLIGVIFLIMAAILIPVLLVSLHRTHKKAKADEIV